MLIEYTIHPLLPDHYCDFETYIPEMVVARLSSSRLLFHYNDIAEVLFFPPLATWF